MPRILSVLIGLMLASPALPAGAAQPLKITVYGGTGMIGQRIVHEALERGDLVTVIVRDPTLETAHHAHLKVRKGDVLDSMQVAQAAAGQDVIVSAVS